MLNRGNGIPVPNITITNSSITGNTAATSGGGVANIGNMTITNSTITGNTAATFGGGVFTTRVSSSASLTLAHTIVSGNTAPSGPEVYKPTSDPLIADDFNLFGINGNAGVVGFTPDTTDTDMDGKVDIVPAAGVLLDDLLAPLADNDGPTLTHALVQGSPGIDGVLFGSCPATDQRGVARPVDGDGDTVARCDIGAFEFDSPPPELAHDLAVTNLIVPKLLTLTDAKPVQTKTVRVQIQNRSAHPETIPNMGVLTELVSLELTSLSACLEPIPTLVPPTKFPLTWKSKQKLTVTYEVTFACANDPAKSTAKDPGHEDFVYTATVDHSALDGQVDDHPADDSCPRTALGTDPNPDGTIKDKGCAEDVTDVVVK